MKPLKVATLSALAIVLAGSVALPAFADRGEGRGEGHGWRHGERGEHHGRWEGRRGEGRHHGGGHHRGMMGGAIFFMDTFDTDKDGKVTQAEIDAVVTERFGKADTNGDGGVTLEEFKPAFADTFAERRVRSFQRLDRDGDGKVTEAEFARRGERQFARLDRDDDDSIESDDRGGRRGYGRGGGMLLELFDTDDDGDVSREEFTSGRAELFAKADKDGDNAVTLAEFQDIWLVESDGRIVRAFQRFDRDGDLKVTRAEVDRLFANLVKRMDRDGDGALSIQDGPRHGEGMRGEGRRGPRWMQRGDDGESSN
ncbi:EF-hand domain-containing protein [Stappia sp. F7233]|uniref:EF-hand domain-containing protein n=1 Tax=Stappia albiluteola TaxID=2758565 RepID=A0A839AHC5_9HYPH|nr:EF-hand domain-containing protein [Stappia albiluteola]MBA5779103.1 EF-hand domain-containing protein [Stappia albiluteola]